MKLSSVNIVEVSSLGDNKCAYCPAPIQHQWRPTGNMTLETFERAVDWVRYFVNQRTQTDLTCTA